MCSQEYLCALIFCFIKRIAKRKKRVEKIELELVMSDFAIGYLDALIFFANLKMFMVTVCRAGTF